VCVCVCVCVCVLTVGAVVRAILRHQTKFCKDL